jgi:hypothetical protein
MLKWKVCRLAGLFLIHIFLHRTEKKEDIKMCDVMEKAVNKGKEEVRKEERINSIKILVSSYRKRGHSDEEIIEDLMESYGLSCDEATKYVNK